MLILAAVPVAENQEMEPPKVAVRAPGSNVNLLSTPQASTPSTTLPPTRPVMATIGATEILQEIRRSMVDFKIQLQHLAARVSELEALATNNKSATVAGGPPLDPHSGIEPATEGSEQVVRLDGRIDLLDGKFNLIKHELKQLYLLSDQQQLSAVSTTWDHLDFGTGLEAGLGTCNSDKNHKNLDLELSSVKTETEMLVEFDNLPAATADTQLENDGVGVDLDCSLVQKELKPDRQRLYRCRICSTLFNQKQNWVDHMKTHSTTTPSPPSVLKLTKSMLNAIELNPTSGKYPCPYSACDQEFSTKLEIVGHYSSDHIRRRPRRTTDPLTLSDSPRELLPKGEKQCPICQRIFSRREHAIRHLKTHSTLQAIFQCPECERSYSRRDKLLVHQREKHLVVVNLKEKGQEEQEPQNAAEDQSQDQKCEKQILVKIIDTQSLSCPQCQKPFNQRSKLARHVVGCQGLKPFACEECGKCFTQKSALIQHRAAIHQGVKRFLCSECGSCFYGSTNYKKHVRSHTGVKPYPCSICGRHFNGRSDLKRHERIHSDVKEFACNQCDLKFHRRDALLKHQLIHTGEKPWMCDLCGSSFSQSATMKKHRNKCSVRVREGKRLVSTRKPRSKTGISSMTTIMSRCTEQQQEGQEPVSSALENSATILLQSQNSSPDPSFIKDLIQSSDIINI